VTVGYSGTPLPTKLGSRAGHVLVVVDELVDNKVCAIDENWSGLRIVHRRENRR